MKGVVLNKELYDALIGDFGPIITLIIVITITLIAILKLGIKFDLNKYADSRKKKHRSLAQLYCPHIRLASEKEGISYQSLFVSPSGTLDWICTQCGTVTHVPYSEKKTQELAEYYLENSKKYKKRMKKFEHHAKKSF